MDTKDQQKSNAAGISHIPQTHERGLVRTYHNYNYNL